MRAAACTSFTSSPDPPCPRLCRPLVAATPRPPSVALDHPRPRWRRTLRGNDLTGTIPTELGLLSKLGGDLCASALPRPAPPTPHRSTAASSARLSSHPLY